MDQKRRGFALFLATNLLCLGSASYAAEDTAPEEEKSAETNDVLSQDAELTVLDPIVVFSVADGSPGVSTVDSETIERQQANSIPELLNDLPGVDLAGSARPQGHSINMWGFGDEEDVSVTLDGAEKTFEKYRQGTVFIEPDLVKQINVEKGAFSPADYGAFGGSVDLVTKSASDMLKEGRSYGGYLKSGFSSNGNEWSNSGALFGRYEPLGAELLVSATKRSNDKFRTADDEELNLSEASMWSGHFKGSLEREDHFLEVSGAFSDSDNDEPYAAKRGQVEPSSYLVGKYGSYQKALEALGVRRRTADRSLSGEYVYDPDNPLIRTTVKANWSRTSQHDKRLVDGVSASLSLGGNESWLTYDNFGAEVFNESSFELFGLASRLSYGAQLKYQERDSLAYVYSYRNNATKNYGWLQPYNIPAGTQKIFSGWAEYEADLGHGITLTPGVRYDHVELEGVPNLGSDYNDPSKGHDYSKIIRRGFSPSLNANWDLNDTFSVFAGAAFKMRAPLLDEVYEGTSTRATSQHLKSERVFAKRFGFSANFTDVLQESDTLRTRVQLYRNDVYDNIYRLFGSPNVALYTEPYPESHHNLKGFYTQGIEAEIFYDSARYFAGVSVAISDGMNNGSLRDMYGDDQPVYDVAPNKLIAQLGFKIPEHDLTFGWKGTFVAGNDDVPDDGFYSLYEESDGYGVHDAYVSWTPQEGRFEGVTARLSVQNIFDRSYKPYLSGFTAKGRSVKAAVSYTF